MKLLVETVSNFQLIDYGTPGYPMVPFNRPAVVPNTNFFQSRISNGQLRLLGQLLDKATDEEFEIYWTMEFKGDQATGVETFLAMFSPVSEEPVTKKGPRRKASEE